MIRYNIVHHVPCLIRLEVPSIKGLSIGILKRLSIIPIPRGIQDVFPNHITGSHVIQYDPKTIDIIRYIEYIASNKEIQEIMSQFNCHEDDFIQSDRECD